LIKKALYWFLARGEETPPPKTRELGASGKGKKKKKMKGAAMGENDSYIAQLRMGENVRKGLG